MMEALDQDAMMDLASQALASVLAPNPDWLERHRQACLNEPVPTESGIESMIDDLRPTVETEEGSLDASLDPQEVRSIARDLGHAFEEAEDRLAILEQMNHEEFLEGLEKSVRWSVRHGQVDHPDLEVGQWMEMAEEMGLGSRARDVLMCQGGPKDLGRWWKYARPLEEDWHLAHACMVNKLAQQHRFDLASQWVGPLQQARLPEPSGEDEAPARQSQPFVATTDHRATSMDKLWAHQVSAHYGEGSCNHEERLAFIRRLEQEGAGDMRLLDWEDLLRAEKGERDLASPQEVGERLGNLIRAHPQAYARWQQTPHATRERPLQATGTPLQLTTYTDGREHLDLYSLSLALRGAGPADLLETMEAVDDATRRLGGQTGYAAAIHAMALDACLQAPTAPRARTRL